VWGKVGSEDAARAVYVPPGQYDEFYAFVSGGFDGQLLVYGLPSGRLLKIVPVFSQYPRNGYGYSEETKAFLMTSHGFIPGVICITPYYLKPTVFPMVGGFSQTRTIHRAWRG